MIKEENILFLNQLIETLESSLEKFKITYDKKDSENFNKIKKTIIETQKTILEIMK